MTLDGFCDHTAVNPDEELHQHYADLLRSADVALYGRITFQLMEYWRTVLENPTGVAATDDFAVVMDRIPKIVFSHKLITVDWATAQLAHGTLKEEIEQFRKTPEKDVLLCSPSLIVQGTQLGLIDEYQLCIHPVLAANGLPLFKNLSDRQELKLSKTKHFRSGPVILYYHPSTK